MTATEARGQVYTVVFIATLISFDIVAKGFALLAGTLRESQLGGTAVTIVACWFLWRGSKIAYGFMLICLMLGAVFMVIIASKLPTPILAMFIVILTILLLTLLAPATRAFAAYQRQARDQ